MNPDPNDPLAPYRREPRPIASEPEQKPLTEHEALKLAITALNEVPNSGVRMEGYTNTYKLIPDLEKAYQAGEGRTKLEELAPRMYRTLLLCEDVLSELGRLDDGTPSISALIDIQAIQKEAGNLSEEQVIKLMQGSQAQASTVHQEHRQPATDVEAAVAPTILEKNEQLKASNAELLEAAKIALRTFLTGDSKVLPIDLLESAIAKATPEQQPAREPSVPEPERDIDLEPDL